MKRPRRHCLAEWKTVAWAAQNIDFTRGTFSVDDANTHSNSATEKILNTKICVCKSKNERWILWLGKGDLMAPHSEGEGPREENGAENTNYMPKAHRVLMSSTIRIFGCINTCIHICKKLCIQWSVNPKVYYLKRIYTSYTNFKAYSISRVIYIRTANRYKWRWNCFVFVIIEMRAIKAPSNSDNILLPPWILW